MTPLPTARKLVVGVTAAVPIVIEFTLTFSFSFRYTVVQRPAGYSSCRGRLVLFIAIGSSAAGPQTDDTLARTIGKVN